MARQPSNPEAEARVIAAALKEPDVAIPAAIGKGLKPDDFSLVSLGWMWEGILDIRKSGGLVRNSVLVQWLKDRDRLTDRVKEIIERLPETPADEAAFWAEHIIERALRRVELGISASLNQAARDDETPITQHVMEIQSQLSAVNARYTTMKNPYAGNPADELRDSERWFTSTGIAFLDQWMRLVSKEVHFIAGDPGCGKTTSAIQIASHNIKNNIPVAIITAESEPIEFQLGLLVQTGAITSGWATRVLYDYQAATPENIKIVEDLWEEHFGGLKIRIFKLNNGVEEALSIMDSLTEPHLVEFDHAYAIVQQTARDPRVQEHQVFSRFFSGVKSISINGNHVSIVYNQFTKEGRKDEERGPDAQYGGSGVQNIAGSLIHLWPADDDDLYTATGNGFHLCHAKCWKVRAMLVADADGNQVDPRGREATYWLETKYRRIADKLPEAA